MISDSWTVEPTRLRKETKNPYAGGCLFYFGVLFLGLITFFVSVFFGVNISEGKETIVSIVAILLSFSLFFVFFISIRTYRKGANIVRTIEFDSERAVLSFRETGRPELEWNLSDLACYMVLYRTETNRNSGRNFWDLYVVRTDGSLALLESFGDGIALKKALEIFKEKFKLPVWDRSGLGLTDSSSSEIKTAENIRPLEMTDWIRTEETDAGVKITLKEPKTWGKRITLFLVPILFYGTWFLAANSVLGDEDPGLALWFFVPFSLLFLGILTVLVVFVMFRKSEIVANSAGIRLLYSTSVPILSYLLSRKRDIPISEIRQIRTLRIEKDMQVLCIALRKTYKNSESSALDFLYNVQSVSLTGKKLPGDADLIGIWTIAPWVKDSPGYGDLVYAEQILQDRLGLKEEALSFQNLSD